MPSHLEALERVVRGELPQPPAAQLIGFRLTAISRGESKVEIDTSGTHANPMGTLHGGILCDVADYAMGTAFASTLEEGETFTTLELKINFLKPVWNDHLVASGRVVQRGKTIGLVESVVTNSKGQRVAYLTSTCMALRGDDARGR